MHLHAKMSAVSAYTANVVRGLYASIARLHLRHAVIFILTSFAVGQAVNRFAPLNQFLLYQLLFIPAIVIAFAEIKIFVVSVGKYKAMIASHHTRDTGTYIVSLLQSYWALPGLFTVGTLYIYATISLKYIRLNPTGYYALVMIGLVMLSAILGQTCYVYYLLLLRRVAASETFKYNFYFPARTDWVQLLTRTGARLSNAFFVLGFIYTLVFFLNMPNDYITISPRPWRVVLTTPNNLAFVASWVTIFIIIIFAFPAYAWLKVRYLRLLIRRLKDISIGEIELLITEGNLRGKGNVDAELKYYQLMTNIENSSSESSDASNLLPVALTICSIAAHLIKISESFSP
ncbi:MAG TPA: hypothetical protein VNA69_18240 [Thermoanaerobaculia bacterium]|nr:hypothetical protein [Thermoanaerobaculia bacterium]